MNPSLTAILFIRFHVFKQRGLRRVQIEIARAPMASNIVQDVLLVHDADSLKNVPLCGLLDKENGEDLALPSQQPNLDAHMTRLKACSAEMWASNFDLAQKSRRGVDFLRAALSLPVAAAFSSFQAQREVTVTVYVAALKALQSGSIGSSQAKVWMVTAPSPIQHQKHSPEHLTLFTSTFCPPARYLFKLTFITGFCLGVEPCRQRCISRRLPQYC